MNLSKAYHPQTDGQSGRIIQTLEDMLRLCMLDFRGKWIQYLPLVEFAYNNSFQATMDGNTHQDLKDKHPQLF